MNQTPNTIQPFAAPQGLPRRHLLLCAAVLAGCGGGESSTPVEAEPESLAADTGEAEATSVGMPSEGTDAQGKPTLPPLVNSLQQWLLELPIDAAGGTTGAPLTLAWPFSAPAGVSLKNHLTIATRAITVRASPWGAVTSENAGGARCEFKQGDALRWNPFNDNRSLSVTLQITRLPAAADAASSAAVHVAQIHDREENLLMVTARTAKGGKGVAKETGRITVTFNHGGSAINLDTGFQVGDTIELTLASRGGMGSVSYRNLRTGRTATESARLNPLGSPAYFKCGAYPQRTGAANKTAAAVVILKAIATGT